MKNGKEGWKLKKQMKNKLKKKVKKKMAVMFRSSSLQLALSGGSNGVRTELH